MRVAVISPIAWRTPPTHYGPWEQFVSLLVEGLVENKIDVTLYATKNSITNAVLKGSCDTPYAEDNTIDPKVNEYLHISQVMEEASSYDIIHNSFDFMPLTYSRLIKTPMITTVHGFSSEKILPIYKKYNSNTHFISISNANRNKKLDYLRTIYHGINTDEFKIINTRKDYLLYFGRIHYDKGTYEAIQISKAVGMKLIIAGIIQDQNYFDLYVKPYLGENVEYIGSVGVSAKNAILGGAVALLHPINFEEPFGFSVVEAMACGTPVIAFNKGSMPEIINHGVNGFLVENIDEAVNCIKNIDVINPISARENVVNRFSVQRMVRDYIKCYEEILAKT